MMDMTDDDLNTPLGQFPVRKSPSLGKMSYFGVALGGLGLLYTLGSIGAFSPGRGALPTPETHAGIGFAASGMASRETTPGETLASLKSAAAPQPGAEISNYGSAPLPSSPAPRTQVIDQTA